MMAGRPVASRAILTAFSTASAPLFTSSVFLANVPGVISVSRRASSIYGGGVATCAQGCVYCWACCSMAATTAGGVWAAVLLAAPPAKKGERLFAPSTPPAAPAPAGGKRGGGGKTPRP